MTAAPAKAAYPRTIPALTTLRFFAAIWVVAFHYVLWLPEPSLLAVPILGNGLLGVDFFFILSGFILAHAHAGQIAAGGVPARPFLVRRLAKIYPMHLATLLFYLSLVLAVRAAHLHLPNPDRYRADQFALNLLLVHGWQVRDAGGWNTPSWSVSAEWSAYLLFPLLAPLLLVRWARVRAELLAAGAAAALLVVQALSPVLLGDAFFDLHANFGYVRILPEFVLGLALYRLGTERAPAALGTRWALPALAAAVVALAAAGAPRPLIVLAIAATILAAAEATRRGHARWLEARPLTYLGEVSYSIYMVHMPVATVLLQGIRLKLGHTPPVLVLSTFPVTVLAAMACYHLIERPAQRLVLRRALGPPRR